MKNIIAAILITFAIGATLTAGVGIALIGFPTTSVAEPAVTPDTAIEPFEYEWCVSLQNFGLRMDKFDGQTLAGGSSVGGEVTVILFPDTTFGVFIYNADTGMVCNITTGWFSFGSSI